MDRITRFLCDPKKVIKSLAVLALSIGVLVYVYSQSIGVTQSDIVTETSVLVSLNDSIKAESFIFRDETVIGSGMEGSIVTVVSEGERVSKGQLLANVYTDEKGADLQDEISRIQRRIDILENSVVKGGFVISDLDKIDRDIKEIEAKLIYSASTGNLQEAIDDSSDFLVKLNKRDLIVNSDSDYSAELQNLLQQKISVESQISSISNPIYASSSGYFYGAVDGYEEDFDISLAGTVTLDNFDDFADIPAKETKKGQVKIVNSFIWNLVCRIDSSELSNVKEGWHYYVTFPENRDARIDMELVKIDSETNSASAILIFRANKLPNNFDYKRFQRAEIVKNAIEGLSVPKKALRYVDGTEGVYVLVGDVVRYRQVKRIAEKDNYYVVELDKSNMLFEDEEKENENKYKSLSLYDNIIVSGKELFDGKIVG